MLDLRGGMVLALMLYSLNWVFADEMNLVFRWRQMDYYNRDDGGVTTPRQPTSSSKITFPGKIRYKRQEDGERLTSRDQPNFESRFGFANNRPNNRNNQNSPTTANSNNQSYIAYNNVPMGATHYRGRLFITMPRRRLGIPSTLNYIDMQRDGSKESPLLNAYPNIETNRLRANNQPNPNGIISVYRTTVDACQRLWFIDTGVLEYPGNRMQVQQPSIWVMDLNTDRSIRRFEIPSSIVNTGRGLASITVDVQANQCDRAFAYIPDLVNSQLYVYSWEQNRIWAFSHNYFRFDPVAGDLNIGGQTFRWDDGIFSITLGPLQPNGERMAFFHAMASNNEFYVSNRVLKNETNAARSDHGRDFMLLGSRGDHKQSTMHAYDPKTGVIFYDEIQQNGVGCWNTNNQFSAANHDVIPPVANNQQRMIYPSDLSIDEDSNVWVMSNSMPIFIYAELDPNVYNFHVWRQSSTRAIRNTRCQ